MTDKKKKKSKTPEGIKVTKEFMFKLTDAEANEKLVAAGNLHAEIVKLEEDFKDVKNTWKSKITTRTAARNEILIAGKTGEEKRTVEAIMCKNYDIKEIEYWHDGKCIEKRTMTESELQMEANFDKKSKEARAQKQRLQKADEDKTLKAAENDGGKMSDIAEVHSLETRKFSKTSAVDGPTRA